MNYRLGLLDGPIGASLVLKKPQREQCDHRRQPPRTGDREHEGTGCCAQIDRYGNGAH